MRIEGVDGSWAEVTDAHVAGMKRLQVSAPDDGAWFEMHDRAVRRSGDFRFVSVVREDDPAADRLRERGYRVGWRSWGAALTLPDEPDWTPYQAMIARATAAGVTVQESSAHDKAYETYRQAVGDMPRTPANFHEPLDPEGFAKAGRLFAAGKDGEYLALTTSTIDGMTVDTAFTVTAAAHRGKGLAAATKAAMIMALHAEGGRVFRTGGAEENEKMLAVNRRLGYVLEPMWLSFVS